MPYLSKSYLCVGLFVIHFCYFFFSPHCVKVAVYLMMDEWAGVAAHGMFCFKGLDIIHLKKLI